MANVRGIFRLNQVYEEQLSGNWSVKSDVFQTGASAYRQAHPFGYFLSGDNPPDGAYQIERVSYDNDTANCLYRAGCPRSHKADAAGNETFMYFGGGEYTTGTFVKYDYSNDTTSTVPGGNFSVPRNQTTAVSNTDYTYFAGAYPARSTVDRIDNSNDTVTTVDPMTAAKGSAAGVGNKNYGYFHGGLPGTRSDMERIDYSTETFLSPKITTTGHSASGHTAFGNADKAYFTAGGNDGSTAIKGFDYSNDTASYTTKGALLFPVDTWPGSTGNSSKGYICGRGVGNYSTNLNRFDYSNDTVTATAAGNLVYRRNFPAAASPQEHGMTGLTLFPPAFRVDWQHGYYAGGDINPGSTSIVDRVDYSNDLNIASRRGNLSQARYGHGATGNKNYAWNGGGYSPPSYLSNVDRIDYSNDTVAASPKSPLSSNKNTLAAVGNENYGYYAGGYSPSNSPVRISSVDRIDYANDTGTITPKGPLSQPRTSLAGTGTLDYGYFGGGDLPGSSSRVDRIDYSSDTGTAAIKGNLAHPAAYNVGAVGNNNYGYWGGGYSPPSYLSLISRLDYSNDDAACLTRGFLTTNKNNTSGASNSSYGWFGGGYNPATRSDVDRIDFSSDTTNLLARGSLSLPKHSVGGSSAKSNAITTITSLPASSPINYGTNKSSYPYGYKMGGYNTDTSRVDRLDFSNDLTNAVTRSSLTQGVQWAMGSASNQDFGYVMGGTNPFTSIVERLDYSNDTQNAAPVGPLSEAAYYGGATGNKDYAWFAYGIGTPSYKTKVERIDYSNDSASGSPKGPTGSPARGWWQGMGNQNYGFFGGGYPAPSDSRIERIDYSNDTAIAVQYGNMPQNGRHMYAAVSNSNYGWFMGGAPGPLSNVDRLDFSNGTTTTVARGNLPRTTAYHTGTGSQNYGYSFGGLIPSTSSYINRIDYDNDTVTASPRGYLTQTVAGYGAGAVSSQSNGLAQPQLANVPTTTIATNFGYFGNGQYYRLDRIDYTNDTATALNRIPNFGLGPSGSAFPAAASSNYAGYWAPGTYSYQNPIPNMRKVDYSNDTTSSIPGALIAGRYQRGATGNKDFGYFAGGAPASFTGKSTNVFRIDYANDNAAALERGPLVNEVRQLTGVGNQNFGYFQTTAVGPGAANRIDYSNDTTTASSSGSLGIQYDNGVAGNGNFAYIAGGSATTSRVLRFDYSNDTTTASQRTYLSSARTRLGATGNKNFGYFSGGRTPTAVSTVDRIDYSNDTATASPKGPLSGTQYQHGNTATSAAESNNPQ